MTSEMTNKIRRGKFFLKFIGISDVRANHLPQTGFFVELIYDITSY